MFTLRIAGQVLDRVAKIATKSGLKADRVVTLAFEKGLSSLEATDSTPINFVDPPVNQSEIKLVSTPDSVFIQENWKKMSDDEMAQSLGTPSYVVGNTRRKLKLFRYAGCIGTRGHTVDVTETTDNRLAKISREPLTDEQSQVVAELMSTKTNAEIAQQLSVMVRNVKTVRMKLAKAFILENWQRMKDFEISNHVGISAHYVGLARSELGLRRRSENTERAKVDIPTLRKAVIEDGETLTGFIRANGLKITRQGLLYLCADNNIDLTTRTPVWHLNYLAKKYKSPKIAKREKIEGLLEKYKALGSVASLLKVSNGIFNTVLKLHGIDFKKYVKMKPARVKLTCSNPKCPLPNRSFLRDLRTHKISLWKNPKYKPCCSMSCRGQIFGAYKRKKRKTKKRVSI